MTTRLFRGWRQDRLKRVAVAMNSRVVIAVALVGWAAAAVAAPSGEAKIVAFGWEMSRKNPEAVLARADEFDKTALDGVGLYLLADGPNGMTYDTRKIVDGEKWTWQAFAPFVPALRKLTRHKSMKECFILSFRTPGRRIAWQDDACWRVISDNMAILARLARQGGLRGLSVDPEDYRHSRQFVHQATDGSWSEARELVRRRGREVFGAVFGEYPDVAILGFWLHSFNQALCESSDPNSTVCDRKDLWTPFLEGALDVLPPGATLHDGNENSYHFEAGTGDFARWAVDHRQRLSRVISPENRTKFDRQVFPAAALYMDMYVNSKEGSGDWYRAPVDGSRLRHFEQNLSQAVRTTGRYVWLWGERHPWIDWGEFADKPKLDKGRWEDCLPGVGDVLAAVREPQSFRDRRLAELAQMHALTNRLDGLSFSTWQAKRHGEGVFEKKGDVFSAIGVGDGCYTATLKDVKSGEYYALEVWVRGAANASTLWGRNGKWAFSVDPASLPLGPENSEGWRLARALVRVPEGVDSLGLTLYVYQSKGVRTDFRDARIVRLIGY